MSLRIVGDTTTAHDVDQETPTFDDFWTLYPRRCAKKDAQRAWARIKPADQVEALTGLVAWRRVWIAKGEMEFVPYPATWLNGERWTDELPAVRVAAVASHVEAKLPESGERATMPQSVRDAIAKLRRG